MPSVDDHQYWGWVFFQVRRALRNEYRRIAKERGSSMKQMLIEHMRQTVREERRNNGTN